MMLARRTSLRASRSASSRGSRLRGVRRALVGKSNHKIGSQPLLQALRISHSQGLEAIPGTLGACVCPREFNIGLRQDVGK